MNETLTIARYASRLRYEDLPAAVVAKTKLLILDQLGLAIGLSAKPYMRPVLDYVRAVGGKKECTVANFGDRTSAESATFANSSFAHAFEYDDAHPMSLSHPGCMIIPPALAIAEREHATGKDLILGVVVGHDVMCKIGSAVAHSALDRGFHTMSVSGPFGAAAAVGSVLRFDETKMLHSLAIAASCACGLTEYQQSGGEVKRIHAGIGAAAGLKSALLAGLGMTGPSTALEGPNGFCRAFADHYDLSRITSGLGEQFGVMEIWTKYHAANGMLHAPVDGLLKMKREHSFALDDIEEVVMGSNHRAPRAVGAMTAPTDMTGFQFSAYYILAVALVKGTVFYNDVTEENLRDPRIKAVAAKVRVEVDPELDALYPGCLGARVTLRLKDGTTYSELVPHCKGTPENPMTKAEMRQKFSTLAGLALPARQIDEVVDRVDRIEEWRDVADFCPLLARGQSR